MITEPKNGDFVTYLERQEAEVLARLRREGLKEVGSATPEVAPARPTRDEKPTSSVLSSILWGKTTDEPSRLRRRHPPQTTTDNPPANVSTTTHTSVAASFPTTSTPNNASRSRPKRWAPTLMGRFIFFGIGVAVITLTVLSRGVHMMSPDWLLSFGLGVYAISLAFKREK